MKKKILVIEDDLDIADLVKLVLESDGRFEVDYVLDSEVAYAKVQEYRPDAILLDLSMPKLDGWAVFRQIRGDDSFRSMPIAILTGKSREFDHMVGLHIMNADAYIAKPFGKQELIDKTYELFKRKN
ncbi:MAG: response regulator [Chitinispirillia bacterium]|nr:response regulator [Chitinispirillia bacterium]MCL2241575.1 response regulator [Chitinispirillia bacterium]